MAYTYRDFGWLAIDYPWTTNAFSMAYISNADPREVIAALTTRSLPNTTGLEGVNETSWEHSRSSEPHSSTPGRSPWHRPAWPPAATPIWLNCHAAARS